MKTESIPTLSFARRVTRRHAEAFVNEFLERAWSIGAFFDGFVKSGVMTWPGPAVMTTGIPRDRYDQIEDELLRRTSAAIRPFIADAFLAAARDVIERERLRQQNPKATSDE